MAGGTGAEICRRPIFAGRAGGARAPAPTLCRTFEAWRAMVGAAAGRLAARQDLTEPMRYDLVDLGRDVLARLTTPLSQNFSIALGYGAAGKGDCTSPIL